MKQSGSISGFSKLTREQKTAWLRETFCMSDETMAVLNDHLHTNSALQQLYEEFSENTISNFFVPYSLAPNFLINNRWYVVPMAIEESSVVAAASHAARFWSANGGFKAEIIGTTKIGQVHFTWNGSESALQQLFEQERESLLRAMEPLTSSMEKRGGGIHRLSIKNLTALLPDYYQLHVEFQTADAMGANFINTVLEALAGEWLQKVEMAVSQSALKGRMEIVMSILSNYTPQSLVRVTVETDIKALGIFSEALDGEAFARKFVLATRIAEEDTYRAVTHNKGIFNGMDGVVIATGNDFRAVEACGHAYAARDGKYRSLSKATVDGNIFRLVLEIPMSVGTVGGLTSGHPLAKTSLAILQNPSAEELMMIIAASGLANNFSAVRALITSGIQKGHMKMHLTNILRQLGADENQMKLATEHFKDKTVTYAEVKNFVNKTKK